MFSRICRRGREVLSDVWEWSGAPADGTGVVGTPSVMFGSRSKSLPVVREWSKSPWGFAGVVGRISRMFGSGREDFPEVLE